MAGDRILVVDDEESVAVTMQAILEMDGYEVMTALNGAEAGELIAGLASSTWCSRTSGSRTRRAPDHPGGRRRSPDTISIILTGYASLDSA